MYVVDFKLAGKKQNLDPMWKLLNKKVDLGEPTSFLDHVYLGCSQRQCQISKDIVGQFPEPCLNPRISAGATEKLTMLGKSVVFLRGLKTWKDHAKKCAERSCQLVTQDDSTTL